MIPHIKFGVRFPNIDYIYIQTNRRLKLHTYRYTYLISVFIDHSDTNIETTIQINLDFDTQRPSQIQKERYIYTEKYSTETKIIMIHLHKLLYINRYTNLYRIASIFLYSIYLDLYLHIHLHLYGSLSLSFRQIQIQMQIDIDIQIYRC